MAKITDTLVHSMANKIQPGVKIDAGKFVEPENYEKDLLEAYNEDKPDVAPVTKESLEAAQDFIAHSRAATVIAFGKVGIDEGFKADAQLMKIKGTAKLGTTSIEVTQHRDWSCRNPSFGKTEDAPERIFQPGRIEVKENPAGGKMFGRAMQSVLEYAGDAL